MSTGRYCEVDKGDCVESLSYSNGLLPDSVWLDPKNASLRKIRESGEVLAVGDKVFIRELEANRESAETGQRHRFLRTATPARLKIRFLDSEERPRANLAYTLIVDGVYLPPGSTDSNGLLDEAIRSNAKEALVRFEGGAGLEEYVVELGHLEPINTTRGQQQRLKNLGYGPGPIDGIWGPLTEAALKGFQCDNSLEATGRWNDDVESALKSNHGS